MNETDWAYAGHRKPGLHAEHDMNDKRIEDLNILSCSRLITPRALKEMLPITAVATESILKGREMVKRLIDREDRQNFFHRWWKDG